MTDTQTSPSAAAASTPEKRVRIVDAELVAPSANQGLMEVFKRRYLLRLLVRRELKGRYEGSFLGFLWSYINPFSQFFIYWFVMGKLLGLHDSVPNFPVHIWAAMTVAHFFTETWGSGTSSLVANKAILKKMAMPRELFPVAAMLVSAFHVGPQIAILLVACLLTGWTPEPMSALALLLALLLCMAFGLALALLFSTANVYFRDFASVVHIINHFLRFGIPMIYSYSFVANALPRWGQELYLANPVSLACLLMQKAFWIPTLEPSDYYAHNPANGHFVRDAEGHRILTVIMPGHLIERGILLLAISAVLVVLAQLVFNRFERRVPDRLL